METLVTVIGILAATFSFAFGMAWFLPLAIAAEKHREQSDQSEYAIAGLDLLLLVLDCIPIFWAFRAVSEDPSMCSEARKKWAEDRTVRGMFYAFCVSLGIAIFCLFIAP